MPKKPRPARRRPAAASKHAGSSPVLSVADVRTILHDLATQMAPADVAALMSDEQTLRERAGELPAPQLTLLRAQLELALDCLRDHLDGACPQIPYYTIALLAAAVSYFSNELDVVPDFLPRVGRLDDAVVMAMACQLADAGLRRYCTWKGVKSPALPEARPPDRRSRLPQPG
jgi:uncharacterized membrane protein YkvA (DUF1232 family)